MALLAQALGMLGVSHMHHNGAAHAAAYAALRYYAPRQRWTNAMMADLQVLMSLSSMGAWNNQASTFFMT